MEIINWVAEKRKVSELKNWEKNPRKITKEAFEKIKDRISKRGFHDVIKVDTENNILSGNQRKRALVDLGIEEVNVLVPSRELTDKERKAVVLESNLSDGIWDFELLSSEYEVEELKEIGFTDLQLGLGSFEPSEEKENKNEKKEKVCTECGGVCK